MNHPMNEVPCGTLLEVTLAVSVPLWIERWRKQPVEARMERAKVCAQHIAEHSDLILYRSKKKGETAQAVNMLAEGLALLSFAPGGVKFAGQHWETR